MAMNLNRRVRSMEKRAGAEASAPCRCSLPILGVGPGDERRVFGGLREFYDGTVQGEPLAPIPLRADRTPEPVPVRCAACGRLIDYVRVRIGLGAFPHCQRENTFSLVMGLAGTVSGGVPR